MGRQVAQAAREKLWLVDVQLSSRFCDDLRATKPVDLAHPVMVAGDPQWNNAAKRMQEGIPVGPGLLNQVRQIAQACAAPWLLD